MSVWDLRVWDFAMPGGLCAATLPGHEVDIGPAMREVEWGLRKHVERTPTIGANFGEFMLSAYLKAVRRAGIPAARAYVGEDGVLTVEVVEPRGYG